MKKIKRLALVALAICLLTTMVPTVPVSAENGEAVLTGVELVSLPTRTEYWTGEALDTSGLTMLANYSDGSVVEVTEGFTVSGFDSTAPGVQTLTVNYLGATAAFTVKVNALQMTGIEIVQLPVKTEYWTGEALDTSGLTLLANYSDGSAVEVTEGFTVSGFDSSAPGVQTLTVNYLGAAAAFTVKVNGLQMTGIEIVRLPFKTEYWTGEALDTSGLTLLVNYSDGSVAEVTEGFTVSGFDSNRAGNQTLTVTYMGAAVTFSVKVNRTEVIGIEIASLPAKTEYRTGEALDLTGLTLRASYSNGDTVLITEGFTVSGFDSSQAGQQTVLVVYGEAAAEFTVVVKETEEVTIVGVEISATPVKNTYWIGEELDTAGLVLEVFYSDGSVVQITEDFTLSGFSSAAAGTKNVQVHYGEFFDLFTVTVKKPTVSKVAIETQPHKTEYWIGEELDTTGLTLKITNSDGSTAIVSGGFTCKGFSSTTAGTKRVIITYSTYSAKMVFLSVTVKEPQITGIAVATLPARTEYEIGEALDVTGLTLMSLYSDGKTEAITEGYTLSGFDSTTIGEKTVTVTYGEFSAQFSVKVNCGHIQAEKGVCIRCNEPIAVVITGTAAGNFITVADALAAAEEGSTLVLQRDVSAEDVVLLPGVALGLNGYTLTVNSVLTYSSSQISGDGLLVIRDTDGNMISRDNRYLPVYDRENGGWRFFWVTVTPRAVTGNNKYWLRVDVENFELFYSLIRSGADVRIGVKMLWDGQEKDAWAMADPAFTLSWAERCRTNEAVYITVSAQEAVGMESFRLIPTVTSAGVEISGEEM